VGQRILMAKRLRLSDGATILVDGPSYICTGKGINSPLVRLGIPGLQEQS